MFHKFLDIQFIHDIDLFNRSEYDPTVINHISVNKEELNPEFFKWLDTLDIDVAWYEAFYTPPNGGKLPIHTDGDDDNYVKINYTYGAPGSTIRWWEPISKEHIKVVETVFGKKYFTIEEDNARLLHEIEVTKPILVNAGLFHSTLNPTNQGRWTLSFPLLDKPSQERISWKDAVNRLKGVIW